VPDISRLVIEIDSRGVLTANGDLEVFSRLGQKAGQTSDDMAKKFGAFQLIVNKLPGPFKSIAGGLMGMVSPAHAAISVFLELGEAAVNFVKESIQAFSDFEMIKANLEVVMGSAKQAAVSFDEIRRMAGRTPFNVEDLASAAVQLKQTGTAARDLIPVLTMLGNSAGGSSEKFNRIVANFAQIQSVGKTMAIDLRQFAMMGIPIYDTLKQMGIEGNATAEQVGEAFRRMTSEGGAFYNSMEKGAATLQGKVTNLEGAWKSLLATITDKTGLDDVTKYIVDAFQFHFSNIDNYINKQSELNDAMRAWNEGTFTEAQALLVLNEKIKETAKQYEFIYDMMNDPYGGVSGDRNYDRAAFELTEELSALREQYNYYAEIIKQEEERTTELERQKKILQEQQEVYDGIMEGVNDRYAGTAQGQIEALEKELTQYRDFLARGPVREVPNLFMPLEHGPQNQDVETSTRTAGISEEDRRKTILAIGEIEDKLKSLRQKLNVTVLKDWQIELGKIFSFTPTDETKGLPTVISYVNDLATARDKLFTTYKDKTIAEALGISRLDHASSELADIQGRLQKMLEFNGSEPWTVEDESIRELLEELYRAKTEYDALYESDKYNEYLVNLDREHELLLMNNEEREREIYLDGIKKEGISRDRGLELWEKQQQNNELARFNEDAADYKKFLDDLVREVELVGLSTKEREKQRLLEENRFLNEENILTVLEKQESIMAKQNSYNTIRSILGTDESGYSANFEKYIDDMREQIYKLNNIISPSDYPVPVQEFESAEGEISTWDPGEEFRRYINDMELDITDIFYGIEQNMRNAITALYEAKEYHGRDFEKLVEEYRKIKGIVDSRRAAKEIDEIINSFDRSDSGSADILADVFGISGLDRAKTELSDIEARLKKIAEFKGTDAWLELESLFNRLKEEYTDMKKTIDELTDNTQYEKYLANLDREHELLLMNNKEREKERYIDEMGQAGISRDHALELWGKQEENRYQDAYNGMKEELDLRKELIGLSEEEARIKELTAELGSEARAREIYALEKEIEKTEALKEAFASLREASISLGAMSLVDFANDLGKAFQDGSASSDEFSDAIRNMLRSLVDAMPQLLLNVGLQLMSKGAWQAGLAFIGASGLMAFVSGLIPDAQDNGRDDELEKLNSIRQQITDLIASQREQEEYYTTKRRQLDARAAINVNDAIITPQGVVNTHPEDYIIATKHPETLMGGKAAPVYINIINNSPETVTTQETTNEDGSRQITVFIDQVVQNGLASGRYDRAMGARNWRASGRHLTS
jgi:hypothetical protein